MHPTVSKISKWRPVLGYEGRYEVSSDGRVRGVPRECHVRSIPGKELTRHVNKGGYEYVTLCAEGECKYRTVHSLVADAFIEPRPEGAVCRHLDGDRLNNSPENLAWGTVSENQYDTVDHGNNHNAAKTRCKRGHMLAEWNVKTFPSDGHIRRRNCRSCLYGASKARSFPKQDRERAIQEHSDIRYESLKTMQGVRETAAADN